MRGEERFNAASAHFNPSVGERERSWARGFGGSRERGNRGRRFGGRDEPDGWAPLVSRQRERGGREGEPAGPWPRKGGAGF